MTEPKKKLIEVALPLEKVNYESAREKSIRHGHPSTLHLWWARRPLAACRAVLFAQLVDDPSAHPEIFRTEMEQEKERERLFGIIEDLVKWENVNNETVLAKARAEILKSAGPNPPPVLDPFCGGGSIPLEAQRLGLEAHASDLNPVAVLITKALIEIPPKFAGLPPVRPDGQNNTLTGEYQGAQGLAEDIRYYGKWMRDEAQKRIGYLYPKVRLPEEQGGGEATVIAWLWARTVASPNPACEGAHVPLVRSFALSTRSGRKAWVEPTIDRQTNTYRFEVRTGDGIPPDGTVNRRGGRCLLSDVPIPFEYIRAEGKAGRMGARLMAIVAEGPRGRVYVSPDHGQETTASCARPNDAPDTDLPEQALGFRVQLYGMNKHQDLFTARQSTALTAFSDLVLEAREQVLADAKAARMASDGKGLEDGGRGAEAYADAVATYLALAVDRAADAWSSLASWRVSVEATRNTFARQALPMVWDYAEANPFSDSCGNWVGACIDWIWKVVTALRASPNGWVAQVDATQLTARDAITSTDPPYYDNIGYADLSDFFYVWLRRPLAEVFPLLFSTLLVPKKEELVATPYRFGGNSNIARDFFEHGLGEAFRRIREVQCSGYPMTVYYAFKQAEATSDEDDRPGSAVAVSTGWETMLEGLIKAGFTITGTWPMRTERSTRPVASGANALASSIVLVCRPRLPAASPTTRRDFLNSLKRGLPEALRRLQQGNIAPVDLAQASIGPGMAIFSRYSKVIEADGTAMRVRTALALINQVLDEYFTEQEGDYDPDTRWAVAWFEQFGTGEGPFGQAETLSKAKNTSVQGLDQDGILVAREGKVRLLKPEEMKQDWDPATGGRVTVWEAVQQLVRAHQSGGDQAAGEMTKRLGGLADSARDLAYRLYSICERKGWASEGYGYNALVASWSDIARMSEPQHNLARQDRPLI